MDAALVVFSRNGFHGSTMQDVATEAGVGKGTIYLYFSSKDQLLEAILTDVLQKYSERISEILSRDLDTRDKLRNLFEYTLRGAERRGRQFSFILAGGPDMGEQFRQKLLNIKNEIMKNLMDFVSESINAGEIRPTDPYIAAHIISGTMNSLVTKHMWREDKFEQLQGTAAGSCSEIADAAVDFLWEGMKQ